MSPEQLDDTRTAGPSTDLWALAVVAYQALTGRLPFRGESAVSLWQAMERKAFEPPSAIVAGMPHELDAWFSRALDPDRAKRFDSARSFADAFRNARQLQAPVSELEGAQTAVAERAIPDRSRLQPPTVPGVPLNPADLRGRRRNPMQTFLVMLAAFVVVGVAVVAHLLVYEMNW